MQNHDVAAAVAASPVGAVVVSEGIPKAVAAKPERKPRKAKPINSRALQAAIDRVEANGPLKGLGALYQALCDDQVYNEVAQIELAAMTKRVQGAVEAGLVTHKTVAAPKGRTADPNKPAKAVEPMTAECAESLWADFSDLKSDRVGINPDRLQVLLDDAMAGKANPVRFLKMLSWLTTSDEEAAADVAETADPVAVS